MEARPFYISTSREKIKVAFVTSGCRANQYDTAALESKLRLANVQLVDFSEIADFYIINSCAITHQASKASASKESLSRPSHCSSPRPK